MGSNSEKRHNTDEKKKKCVTYIFIRNSYMKFQNHSIYGSKVMLCIKKACNPYMKFQNPSMHGSEVMLCIKKRNIRTYAPTDVRMHDRPRSNMPLQLRRGGIKIRKGNNSINTSNRGMVLAFCTSPHSLFTVSSFIYLSSKLLEIWSSIKLSSILLEICSGQAFYCKN